MAEIKPYAVTFLTLPRYPWPGMKMSEPKARWFMLVEAYTAEDALTQFNASAASIFRRMPGHSNSRLFVEQLESATRCPKGHRLDRLDSGTLLCTECHESFTPLAPRYLYEVPPTAPGAPPVKKGS